jgi:hypothetical protein
MNVKHLVAAGALVATTVVGSGLPAVADDGASSPTTTATTCLPDNHDDTWPLWADGKPALDPGVRIWHDTKGWHVRVTHASLHERTFAGVIRTRGELVDVTPVRLEGDDRIKVSADMHTLGFRFHNYGRIDGFDFKTHCAPGLSFGFLSDGKVVPPRFISIGAAGRHPARDPFTIRRTG